MKQLPKTIRPVFRQSSLYSADGESGIVLAVVLILLGITVALVLHAQVLAHSCLNLENKRLLRTQLRETAGDGVWRALNILAADPELLIDHTNEEWAVPMHICLPNGIDTEMMIIDENRFIDANMLAFVSPSEQWRLPAAVVRDLLAGELFPNPELQTSIMQDWVEPTSPEQGLRLRRLNQNQEGNYETGYYRQLAGQIEAANSTMTSREELLWLFGATTNAAAKTTALTVLPAQVPRIEPINVNTASRQTLRAVLGDNNAGLVEKIIRLRNAVPLLNLDQLAEPVIRQRFAAYLSVRSSFFSVYSRAAMGASTELVYCLARRDQTGNIQVIRWVER